MSCRRNTNHHQLHVIQDSFPTPSASVYGLFFRDQMYELRRKKCTCELYGVKLLGSTNSVCSHRYKDGGHLVRRITISIMRASGESFWKENFQEHDY
ncbi:unnamed protein product [Lathyrus sativus]|nr:unnamed protein product [Lathyrus sativus]